MQGKMCKFTQRRKNTVTDTGPYCMINCLKAVTDMLSADPT
jgi:hypothetical protein